MRIRKQLAVESGAGLLYAGAEPLKVNYEVTRGALSMMECCVFASGTARSKVTPSGPRELPSSAWRTAKPGGFCFAAPALSP